jgi:hypothetical protein
MKRLLAESRAREEEYHSKKRSLGNKNERPPRKKSYII